MNQMRITAEVSPGITIPDSFAKRLVDAMLADLDAHQPPPPVLVRLGNPKAQRRSFDRSVKAHGDWLLRSSLKTGKNHHYTAIFTSWVVDPEPPGRLVALSQRMRGEGPGKGSTSESLALLVLSRHALERLVQRGAVRTAKDLVALLKSAFLGSVMAGLVIEHLPADGVSSWIIPVATPSGGEVFLPVRHSMEPRARVIATTALSSDMIVNMSALEPLRALMASVDRLEPEKLLAALDMSALATRRGRRAARANPKPKLERLPA